MEEARIQEQAHNTSVVEDSAQLCTHCGAPIQSHISALCDNSGKSFCCPGCRAVYELIASKGLSHYYDLVRRYGASLQPVTNSESGTYAVETPDASSNTVRLRLGGIQCASCVWLLERLPIIHEGVTSARVNLTLGELTVSFDPAITTSQRIADAVQQLGYPVMRASPENGDIKHNERESLIQIGVAAACSMNIMMLAVSLYQGEHSGIEAHYVSLFRWVSLALTVPIVTYSALPIYRRALGALRAGTLHIDLPISIGIVLSIILGTFNTLRGAGEIYFDSLSTIILLLLSTRHLQRRAFETARNRCASHWSLLPSHCTEVCDNGATRVIPLTTMRAGMLIQVPAGERIPCDGVVEGGTSSLDCSTITGESLPIHVEQTYSVLAGSLNLESPLLIRVATGAGNSRLDRIISTVASSASQPPQFITSYDTLSMLFTAAALLLSVGAFLIHLSGGITAGANAAIAMLTVTCPCAVALALPLLSMRALSATASRGILVRSPEAFEKLPLVTDIYLDKTGTITDPKITATAARLADHIPSEAVALVVAILVEVDPNHPVSQGLKAWLEATSRYPAIHYNGTTRRIPGCGVEVLFTGSLTPTVSPKVARLTSLEYFNANRTTETSTALLPTAPPPWATVSILTADNEVWGYFELASTANNTIKETLSHLATKAAIHILSGDRPEAARHIAEELRIDPAQAHGGLAPEEKAEAIRTRRSICMYVGDGANDAPALAAATIGVALRGGIQSILESADVFIQRGGLEQVVTLRDLATRYHRRARLIIGLGLLYNALGVTLAFAGYVSPLVAAIAMPTFSLMLVSLAYFSLPAETT